MAKIELNPKENEYVWHWTMDEPVEGEHGVIHGDPPHSGVRPPYGRMVKVTKVWGSQLPMPLVNLENGETSVAHVSYLLGASHGFYTMLPHTKEKLAEAA